MAKKSAVERNKKRIRLARQYANQRDRLKTISTDETEPAEARFSARMKLAELPRNSSPVRQRNRCLLSGRPRGYYRDRKSVV